MCVQCGWALQLNCAPLPHNSQAAPGDGRAGPMPLICCQAESTATLINLSLNHLAVVKGLVKNTEVYRKHHPVLRGGPNLPCTLQESLIASLPFRKR